MSSITMTLQCPYDGHRSDATLVVDLPYKLFEEDDAFGAAGQARLEQLAANYVKEWLARRRGDADD